MKTATLRLSGEMWWSLSRDDPQFQALESLNGARVINPLTFNPQTFPFTIDRCYLITEHLSLILPDASIPEEQLVRQCLAFLRALRLLTRQAALPTEIFAVEFSEVASLPPVVFPCAPQAKGFLMGKYRLDTAVTTFHISETDKRGVETDIPIFHEVLLDALHAYERHDDREAILFAAIATEALARTLLDAEYRKVVAAAASPAHMNILSFPQPGGHAIRKDPIYLLLADSDTFSRLLHEVPLYLIRRSLLDEDQALYKRAISLYRTRNRISHGRRVEPDENDLFLVDRDGALQGLATAIAVFEWFGISGYFLPVLDPVPFGGE